MKSGTFVSSARRAIGELVGRVSLAVRRRGAAVRSIAPVVAVTLAVVALLIGSCWFYAGWRMGQIELTTEGQPVVAQVLDETSDTAFGEPFDLAKRAVVALPAGEYRLRVEGTGRLGRTFRFAVNRGETQSYSISIDEGVLLGATQGEAKEPKNGASDLSAQMARLIGEAKPEPVKSHGRIRFAPVSAALELNPGKAHLVEWADGSLICRDGATGEVVWDALHPRVAFDRSHDPAPFLQQYPDPMAFRCRFVAPVRDLNGDLTGDLVLSLANGVEFVALSGKDGSLLWSHRAAADGHRAAERRDDDPRFLSIGSSTEGDPAIADVNGDGTADLIATFLLFERPINEQRRVVVAISGRSGEWLWTFAIDKTPIKVPEASKHRPAVVVQGRQSGLVAYVDGSEWMGLDPATGKMRAGPIDLGFVPVTPVQYADLDGDGEPEVLALGPGPVAGQRELRAFSIKGGREIWRAAVDAAYEDEHAGLGVPPRDRPLIADLDEDGRPEIVVADAGALPPSEGFRGVRMIDGPTGATRWRLPMRPAAGKPKGGVVEIVLAPDLDGDGTRDVITVSVIAEGPARGIYVDGISGKGGHRLWWNKLDVPAGFTRIRTPQWWGRGPDGWPLLALPTGGEVPEETIRILVHDERVAGPIVHLLEASTGRKRHTVTDFASAGFADLDGDGLIDLWGDSGGDLRAIRGEAPEAWRALGRFDGVSSSVAAVGTAGDLGADFDGDGILDTLNGGNDRSPGNANSLIGRFNATPVRPHGEGAVRSAVARSGADGHLIWKSPVDRWASWFDANGGRIYDLHSFPSPAGDLDGDGTADVIASDRMQLSLVSSKTRVRMPIEVLSGRTGARVWSAGYLPLRSGVQAISDINWIDARVVAAHGAPDLIVNYNALGRVSRLARVSGRNGRIVWDVLLPAQNTILWRFLGTPVRGFGDLDGDGQIDAVVVVPTFSSARGPGFDYTLVAVSSGDGKQLWSQTLAYQFPADCEIRVGDVDGDKRADVICKEGFSAGLDRATVRVFDGRDGKVRWSWSPAVDQSGTHFMALADFDGNGAHDVCVNFKGPGQRRIMILDGNGKERAHRDFDDVGTPNLQAVDLDGDGRDELLLSHGGFIRAWDSDLKELWCRPSQSGVIGEIVPGSPGRAREVILSPGGGLVARTGQPRWRDQAPLAGSPPESLLKLLDAGDSGRLPILIGGGFGSTVCRLAMPTTADGSIAPIRGNRAHENGRGPEDPRWRRVLPWFSGLTGAFGPMGFLISGGLALVNVGLPVLILWLTKWKQRQFNIRTLLVLPLVVTIPLMSFLSIGPALEVWPQQWLWSEELVFLAGTLLGIPIVCYVVWIGASLVCRRWKRLLSLVGLTVVTTLVVAGAWIWFDRKSMARLEHYGWEGWWLVFLPGVYVAVVLWVVGQGARWIYEVMGRWNKERRVERARAKLERRDQSAAKGVEISEGGHAVKEEG
jgi:FG-GAP-like repeat